MGLFVVVCVVVIGFDNCWHLVHSFLVQLRFVDKGTQYLFDTLLVLTPTLVSDAEEARQILHPLRIHLVWGYSDVALRRVHFLLQQVGLVWGNSNRPISIN